MADNNRDVSLQVTASTVGAESIRNLAKDVHELAKQGGDAAPEFERLASELDKLAGQQDAIENFTELRSEVEQLAAGQVKAKEASAALGKELADLSGATSKFQQAEQQAKQEIRAAQRDIDDKRDALVRLKLEYDDTGKKTGEYKARVDDLARAILDAKVVLRDKKDALFAAQQATRDAGEAERQLAAQSKLANAEVTAATRELTRRTAALNESRDALQSAGVATDDMTAAQRALGRAFADTVGAVERQQAAVVALRQTEADAAARARQALEEEDRLTSIQINNRYRLEAAAREQLDAERRQYTEAANLAKQAADAKIAAEQRYQQFVQGAAQARKALDDAFAQTGVRSAQSVRIEIDRINSALVTLANDASVSGAEFDRAFASGKARIEALEQSLNGTAEAANRTSASARLVSSAFAQVVAAYGGMELGKKFLDANIQLEALRRSLAITSGSLQEAGRQIEFLRNTANSAGIAVGEISNSYLRFSVSLQQAGIAASTTEAVFATIIRATGQMGQGSERAAQALEALSQMAGKGTVSMEELRQQLGDSLPGALKLAADGLGLSVKQLSAMTEAGQIMAADMLPALAAQLAKTIAKGTDDVQGFQATWARLKNTMTLASQTIGDTGALDALGVALRGVGVIAGSVLMGVSTTLDLVFTGVKQVATLTAGVVNGDLKGAVGEAGVLFDQMIDRQAKLGRALQNLAGAGETATASQAKAGAAAQQAGRQIEGGAAGVAANATAHNSAATAAAGNAQAQASAGAAAAQAGGQAAGAAAGWYAIQAAYVEVNKQAEANTIIAEKLALAKKHEGETAVQLATMAGNEIEMRRVASNAAAEDEVALRRLSAARQQEVVYLRAQVESLRIAAAASGGLRDDQKEQIKTLTDLIAKKEAEAERAKVSAEGAASEAASRRLASEVYKDNAGRLEELRVAAKAASDELARMKSQEVDNADSHAAVAEAARGAAMAEGLYRDALADTARAAERKIAALRQDAAETEIGLRASLAHARTQEREAELYGQVGLAAEARIRQKQIEIETVRKHISAVEAETQQTIAAAEASRAELAAKGELTPAKEAEIDLRVRNARAKLQEAQAGEESIRQLQLEIDAIRMRNQEAQNTARTEREVAAERVGGRGGMMQATQNDALAVLGQKQQRGELGADDLKAAQAAFNAASFNREVMQGLRPGTYSLEGIRSIETAYNQSRSILDAVQGLQKKSDGGTPKAGAAKTVNINLNGKNTPVNVASDADASNLTAVMRQLESLSGRSNV